MAGLAGCGADGGAVIAPVRPREWLVLAGILLVAAGLRVATADYGLWFDELASLVFAHQPLAHLWGPWMVRETNPPLFYTLLKGWIALAGEGDRPVRLLSIAIGTVGIGAAWALARRLGGPRAAWIAAALTGLSAAHIDLSQEVRGYGLAHAAVLAALLGMVRYLERRDAAALLLYGGATVAALYAHTMLVLFALLANLAMIAALRADREALMRWIACNAAVGLAWAWWGWITLQQLSVGHGNIGWIPRPSIIDAWTMTGKAYVLGVAPDGGIMTGMALAVLIGAIAWLVRHDRRPAVLISAFLVVAAPVLLFALSQLVPVFLPRTVSWASGPATVLLAVALASIPSRSVTIAAVAALLLLESLTVARWLPVRQEEAWEEAVAAVARSAPHPLLLAEGDATALVAAHYRDRLAPTLPLLVLPPDPDSPDHWSEGLAPYPHPSAEEARRLLCGDRELFTLRRVWGAPARTLESAGIAVPVVIPGDRQPFVTRWRCRSRPSSSQERSGRGGDRVEPQPGQTQH